MMLSSVHQDEEAERVLRSALSLMEKVLGGSHVFLVETLGVLGALAQRRGRYGESENYYKRRSTLIEQTWGPQHANYAASLVRLSSVQFQGGKLRAALARGLRALKILETAPGASTSMISSALYGLS